MQPRTPGSTSRLVGSAVALLTLGGLAAGLAAMSGDEPAPPPIVSLQSMPVPPPPPLPAALRPGGGPAVPGLTWRLNNPAPNLIPESRANPAAVADKFASRNRAIEERARLRAFEGAPPLIPHAITDLNIQTCRSCHAQGLTAGDKVARMVSHTYLANCTQCHVEAAAALGEAPPLADNTFVGFRSSGYGGTRAWTGAPPVMPHTSFMRTNCVSCHGEHGYDGWRPDHLSRTNCVQCHAPAAEFDQLSPAFNVPDLPDGFRPSP